MLQAMCRNERLSVAQRIEVLGCAKYGVALRSRSLSMKPSLEHGSFRGAHCGATLLSGGWEQDPSRSPSFLPEFRPSSLLT